MEGDSVESLGEGSSLSGHGGGCGGSGSGGDSGAVVDNYRVKKNLTWRYVTSIMGENTPDWQRHFGPLDDYHNVNILFGLLLPATIAFVDAVLISVSSSSPQTPSSPYSLQQYITLGGSTISNTSTFRASINGGKL